ncbi:uncharacterized protein LOC128093508 [Culex pipiens pallens]|uniref:uncharacterized protein LOC128093508 n=1 Tax=Culex pipiens pallens TaxID=42434 RepID=UPI0022AACC0A|nr:uncharacterized protein LOC128093508 [Culex pipiens pallens]
MNAFIALFVTIMAVAAQAGHAPTSWPVTSYGVDSWNGWNGLNSWNNLQAYPYGVNQLSTAWPAYNSFNGWYPQGKTVIQANVASAKVNPWGLPLTTYGYGYNNYLGAVPATKYISANPWSTYGAPQVGHVQKLIVA